MVSRLSIFDGGRAGALHSPVDLFTVELQTPIFSDFVGSHDRESSQCRESATQRVKNRISGEAKDKESDSKQAVVGNSQWNGFRHHYRRCSRKQNSGTAIGLPQQWN